MERITQESVTGAARYGHEFRYRLAAGFVNEGDCVLDAACGTGYGYEFLYPLRMYIGIDRIPLSETVLVQSGMVEYQAVDLTIWTAPMSHNWYFDVFIGFETIEHLSDYGNYVNIAHQAAKWILVSAPVIPHANPYHVRDFVPGELQTIFENEDWEHYQTVQQPSELSEIVVLRRRT